MEKINYQRINTENLLKGFCAYKDDNLSIEDGGLRLARTSLYEPGKALLENYRLNIIDITADECDLIYFIDSGGTGNGGTGTDRILTYDRGNEAVNEIGCRRGALSELLDRPSAIRIDKDTIYIAGSQHLIAFARSNLQIRWVLPGGPGGQLSGIIDFAVDFEGNIYALDKGNKDILKISRGGKVLGIVESNLSQPTDIAVDRDGDIYVLDEKRVYAYTLLRWDEIPGQDSGRLLEILSRDYGASRVTTKIEKSKNDRNVINIFTDNTTISLKLNPERTEVSLEFNNVRISGFPVDNGRLSICKQIDISFSAKGLAVDATKQIFVGEPGPDAAGPDGVEKTIYRLDLDGSSTPLWSYRGAAGRLITDSKGNLYVVNHERDKLVFLQYRDKAIYRQNERKSYSGTYISKPIDSQIFKTRWHRFLLDGKFYRGTKVEFSYYVSDEPLEDDTVKNLSDKEWRKGLPDSTYIQGEEKRDALFHVGALGRYVWFKINLIGNEEISPVVKSVTVFFPRASYLDYLPAIYQEDPVSRDFLERFLSISESIFSEIEFNVEHISRSFDAFGAPPEFLSWLGSWLAVSMDENWTEDKKRRVIKEAISLYKKRGTREGLERMIALCTGQRPSVVENFTVNRPPQGKECKLPKDAKLLFFPPYDATTTVKKPYLFNWDEVQENGNDTDRLKRYLIDKFSTGWVDAAGIEKTGDTIQISSEGNKNNISLTLERNKISLVFDDGRTYELTAKRDNGATYIYEETEEVVRLSDVLFGREPFCFCVFLDGADISENTIDVIRRIIEEQKPAHTCYGIKVLEPWFYLDSHTYLGVNTSLSEQAFVLGRASVVGRDTVLYDRERSGQVRVHSRVGVDTRLT